jgi:hypothetical protein
MEFVGRRPDRGRDLERGEDVEAVDGHHVEVEELRGGDGEVGREAVLVVDQQRRHAPTALDSEALEVLGGRRLGRWLRGLVEVDRRRVGRGKV